MSEKYFFSKFSTSITDILDIIQTEHYPSELNSYNKENSSNWSFKDCLNFSILIYFKYIEILKNIEDSYDQTINPQLRKYIKKFLENILCRIVQIKKDIIFYNNPIVQCKGVPYVFLDDYLIDYKKEPRDLNLPIPQYFKEDTSSLVLERKKLIDEQLLSLYGDCYFEEDVYSSDYIIENIEFNEAINILQNFEMGRQCSTYLEKRKLEHNKKGNLNSKDDISVEDIKKLIASNVIAIYKLKNNKFTEMELLKMISSDPNDEASELNVLNLYSKLVREHRKKEQYNEHINYENEFKNELIDKFNKIEKDNLRENMINERRDWIINYIKENNGEPPTSIKLFDKRNEIEKKVELDDNQKKAQENIAKDKLKKQQDVKKKEEGGQLIKLPLYGGGSKEVKNLEENINEFNSAYENASEYFVNKEYNAEIARNEIIDNLYKQVEEEANEIIKNEIKNIRKIHFNGKDPYKEKPEKSNVKEKFGTGENKIKNTPPSELLLISVENKILRKMAPKLLDDLICDFNYIGNSMLIVDEKMIDVPLFYIKQLVKEFCIYPLGCPLVRKNSKINTNSILFFGPKGTGKTHAALAVAYHADAVFFDFTYKNLERFKTKEEITLAVATAFRAARTYQPAVFYFDDAEEIFPKSNVKGMKKNQMATRLKKLFMVYKNLITPEMRIMFIGCSNRPHLLHTDDFNKFFDRSLYFGYPSTSDRFLLWKTHITKHLGNKTDIEFDVLAQMSMNFSWKGILDAINNTLSSQRIKRSKFDPVKTEEFIPFLSKTDFLFKEEFNNNRNFLYASSGLKDLHDYLDARRAENERGRK